MRGPEKKGWLEAEYSRVADLDYTLVAKRAKRRKTDDTQRRKGDFEGSSGDRRKVRGTEGGTGGRDGGGWRSRVDNTSRVKLPSGNFVSFLEGEALFAIQRRGGGFDHFRLFSIQPLRSRNSSPGTPGYGERG